MTRYEPSLVVTRTLVQRGQLTAYDERFHTGVNIVRGENSSGKSTVLNLIFYGLGGDLADWSAEALLCSRVILEVQLNGKTATLSRDISSESGRPMEIFGGDSEAALKAPATEWTKYPYSRSQNKESFSQTLFRLLGIPEVANEATGNLTMHQILRLLYADQLSPVENLFRFDRFDPPTLRDAIGRLLCGAYDNELYQNELQIRAQSKDFDSANGELKSLFSVLGKTQEPLTLEWVDRQRRSFEEERAAVQRAIEATEREVFTAGAEDSLTLKAQNAAYAKVQRLQLELGKAQEELDALALSTADSVAFIRGLEQKLQALNDADLVAKHVGDIQFLYCPACYAPIEKNENPHACHLCKTPFDSEHAKTRIVAMINETAVQLRQSRVLQENRTVRMEELQARNRKTQEEWQVASSELAQLRRLPSTEVRERLRELQRKAGYLQRQLEDLENRTRLIELVDELSKRKAALEDSIRRLQTRNEQLRHAQAQRLARAYTLIADEIRKLLHNDLPRELSFEKARNIEFDFVTNKISVDGETYFSASSRVILKSSFFVGFLAAATKEPFFRHPRFCMIDTVEDKGMEPIRSHNFQKEIVRISEQSIADHQIIYATSMIAPQFDAPQFTIGKASTHESRTLNIGQIGPSAAQ